VVASDVGAFSELIEDGATGTLIARDDLKAMVEAAGRLMEDDEARAKAASASLRRARTLFPLRREAEALIRIYRKLAAAG
jgi:mannosyltransferase